jgi:dienelactone hydrolase
MILWTFCQAELFAGEHGADVRVLPPGQLPQDARLYKLKDQNGYFPFVPPKSREAWKMRAEQIRRQVLVASGLWPMPEKAPLHAIIHGKVNREENTVEKVHFESYPGHFFTGSLYRPKGRAGKLPVVLAPHGHWENGRFFKASEAEICAEISSGTERAEVCGRYLLQSLCVQLVRMGCVVFQCDMVGFADSKQIAQDPHWQPEKDSPDRWGMVSPQAELRLQTNFGLQTYNSLRALDFVCELPEVDVHRIGMTSASGGGTQTFILDAIDPRPTVAFPAVMVSAAMQGGCHCENAPYLRIATGNVEFAALFAPKPLGMTAANDWTKDMNIKGSPQFNQLYRMLEAEDRVMLKPLLQSSDIFRAISRSLDAPRFRPESFTNRRKDRHDRIRQRGPLRSGAQSDRRRKNRSDRHRHRQIPLRQYYRLRRSRIPAGLSEIWRFTRHSGALRSASVVACWRRREEFETRRGNLSRGGIRRSAFGVSRR